MLRLLPILLIIELLIFPSASFSAEVEKDFKDLNLCKPLEKQYYNERERGWFYNEFCKIEPKDEEKKSEVKEASKDEIDWEKIQDPEFLEKLTAKKFKELLIEVREDAVYKPTEKKLLAYMKMQNFMKEKSLNFSYTWRDVLLENPELNPSIENPTTSFGKNVQFHVLKAEKEDIMSRLIKDTGLFFFVSGDCPYCHAEADVIKYLKRDYNLAFTTISKDHCEHPKLESCSVDPELFDMFSIKVTPTIFAVFRNEDDKPSFQPISTGVATEEEIVNMLVYYYKKHSGEEEGM